MNRTELLETLCELVELQAEIIRNLAAALDQIHCLDEADREAIAEAELRLNELNK